MRDAKDRPLWNALYYVGHAYQELIRADALDCAGQYSGTYETLAIDNIVRAADTLGFDLVKRQKQEAA